MSTTTPTPAIDFFTAEPTYIAPGQSVTLNWQCTGISYCILSPPPNDNHQNPSGNTTVSPQTDTTYTLDAYGPGDVHLQAQVNVQVQSPQVVTFYSDASSINYNGTVFLNWETENADSVQLSAVPEVDNIPASLPVSTTGSGIQVGPLTQATTFMLTPISNTVPGTVSTPVSIDINPATATFTASPNTNVWQQDEVTLTWNITNAATVTLTPPLDGGPSLQNLSGSMVINPESDVNYVLTVTGAPNTTPAVETVSFAVTPVTADFSASPNPVSPLSGPNQATLAWNTQAQVASINQGIGAVTTTGQQVVNAPVSGTVYTLTAGTTQNPVLQTAQVTITNQYGPFTFTQFDVQYADDNTVTVITLNVYPGFTSADTFEIQLEGIALTGADNITVGAVVLPNGQLCLLSPAIINASWINPQNQQATITILNIFNP